MRLVSDPKEEALMPARSIVTRENLSRDFAINPAAPHGGPLELNLNPAHFSRNPTSGMVSVTVGGGGGGGDVSVSADAGNIIEMRDDGLFADAPSASVEISDDAGNLVEGRADGLFVGAEPISSRSGNMASRITGSGAGLYVGAPAVQSVTASAGYTISAAHANQMILLSGDAVTATVPTSGILAGAEYTILRIGGEFSVNIPAGVEANGIAGPCAFSVQALPNGVVLKCLAADQWILLGDAVEV